MNNFYQPLIPENIYLLFSRAIGNEMLFKSKENYVFFLQKLKQHTSKVCDLYCYTLLPNHFHLLVSIKDEKAIQQNFEDVKKKNYSPDTDSLPDFISERFSNFLNSYSKAFNKVYQRKGSLFIDYMRRSKVAKDDSFSSVVWYIHKNAVHHKLTKRIGDWEFDSYHSILSDSPTSLLREELLKWFGSREAFINFHQQPGYPKNDIIDI